LLADVDADVADVSPVREEHEIARLESVAIEPPRAQVAHFARRARQRDAGGVAEHVADETAAIEPTLGRVAAEPVWCSDEGDRSKEDRVGGIGARRSRFQRRLGSVEVAGTAREKGNQDKRREASWKLRHAAKLAEPGRAVNAEKESDGQYPRRFASARAAANCQFWTRGGDRNDRRGLRFQEVALQVLDRFLEAFKAAIGCDGDRLRYVAGIEQAAHQVALMIGERGVLQGFVERADQRRQPAG